MIHMKPIDTYNAKDIYSLFSTLYEQKYQKPYKGVGFIGNEMHKIKELIDEYGSTQIACATVNCLKQSTVSVSVPYFTAGIKYYIIPHNPDVYWAVTQYGTPSIQKQWKQFLLLDAKWFPSATQQKQYKDLDIKLKEWAYAKTSTKTGTANTKAKK